MKEVLSQSLYILMSSSEISSSLTESSTENSMFFSMSMAMRFKSMVLDILPRVDNDYNLLMGCGEKARKVQKERKRKQYNHISYL